MKKYFSTFCLLFLVFTLLLGLFSCVVKNAKNPDGEAPVFDGETPIPDDESPIPDSEAPTFGDETPEEVDFTKLTVNCLGDSLTYGANPNGSQMQFPYPALLKEKMGFSAVNNYGIGGTKIANEGSSSFCQRYVEMPDADIVLVMGGTNDALSFSLDMIYRTPLGKPGDLDETTFYGALNSLCYKLQNTYRNSFIAFITPLPIADYITEWTTASGSFSIEDACVAIKTVCAQYHIPVFDAYNETGFGDLCNVEYANGSGDGIHPSQAYWSDDFVPKLAEFIKNNYK